MILHPIIKNDPKQVECIVTGCTFDAIRKVRKMAE